MRTNKNLLELLLEIQTLDRVPRLGFLLRGVPEPESVTEHSWHVLFLVWALCDEIAGVDRQRALDIAMVHDLAEVRLGDLPRTASRYFPESSKQQAEWSALEEILSPLSRRTQRLLEDYQKGQTPEARLVRACDKLQLMLKVAVYESWGARGLERFWNNPDNFYDGDFPEVRRLYEQLKVRRANGESLARG